MAVDATTAAASEAHEQSFLLVTPLDVALGRRLQAAADADGDDAGDLVADAIAPLLDQRDADRVAAARLAAEAARE